MTLRVALVVLVLSRHAHSTTPWGIKFIYDGQISNTFHKTRKMDKLDIPTLTEFLERVARQEESKEPFILHYDSDSRDLRAWLW